MADPGIDPRYAAQFQRGFDPAEHAPVERVAIERPTAARPTAEQADDVVPWEDADEFPASRPRTEWALLAVGILLPVLAVAVWWASVTDPRAFAGYTMSPVDQFTILLQSYLPGPMLVAGVVAIVAWVVLRAVGRAR